MNETEDNNLISPENAAIVNSCDETTSIAFDGVDEEIQVQKNKYEFDEQQQDDNEIKMHNKESIIVESDNSIKAILDEMGEIYSERITEIDEKASGDYKLKCVTYKEWVNMLIGLIHHMFESLKDLELNAKNVIMHLERKLNEHKILDHADLNSENLKNDLLNLLTLIRHAIEKGNWDITGLDFKTITEEQIFGTGGHANVLKIDIRKLNSKIIDNEHNIDKLSSQNNILKTEIEKKDLQISKLQGTLKKLENVGKCKTDPLNENNNELSNDDIVKKLKISLEEQEQLLAQELQKNEVLTTELEVLKSKCDRKEKQLNFDNNNSMSTGRPFATALNSLNSLTDDNHYQKQGDPHLKPEINKLIEIEESKLRACQAEEDMNLKILGLELEELFELKQCAGDESLKELEQMIERFRTKIRNVIIDQTSMKKKLHYIRNQLIKIVNGEYESKDLRANNMDCGYILQDENNLDNGLIKRISEKISNLEDELFSVKDKVGKLQLEIENTYSVDCTKNLIIEKQRKILKDLAIFFGKITGAPINVDTVLQESNENENIDLFSKNIFCDSLENLIIKKDRTIEKLQECNQQIENTIKQREAFLSEIRKTLEEKETLIQRLNDDLRCNDQSIKVLTHEKNYLNEEIMKLSNLLKNSDSKRLLNEIEELQTLNKNQIITISNLMEALENVKREHHTTGNASYANGTNKSANIHGTETSNIVDDSQNGSGSSLWGWLRGNTYDV